MNQVIAIQQPNYLPWLGYFEQINKADTFVFLENVQYENREWQNRNRLKGFDEKPFYLTVPLQSHPSNSNICDIRISHTEKKWRKKHLRSIEMTLGKAPYFSEIYPHIENWLLYDYEYLADLNIAGIKIFSSIMGLSTRFVKASKLSPKGKKTALIVDICKKTSAKVYYSSVGAKAYMENDRHLFSMANIQIEYQNWHHPVYKQRGNHFVSHLSILDALMNIGIEKTKAII